MAFSKKFMNFSKMARRGKFAVKRIWNSKIPQNLQRFRWYTKIKRVPQKNWIYSEMAKGSNFAVERNWKCQFSHSNFSKNLSFFTKKNRFSLEPWTFSKVAKHSKFAVECDRINKILQNVWKTWAVVVKKMGFPKKIDSSETTEASKFAVERN